MAKSRKKRNGTCAICGKKPAVTVDHVPPKGIFPKPRPQLITVPACLACNHGASKFDERFKVFLSLHGSYGNEQVNSELFAQALKTVTHNRALQKEILADAEEVYLTTKTGIVFDRAYRIRWDSKSHDEVIERTIRGLYFHHFGEVLGERARVKVQWLKGLGNGLYEQTEQMAQNVIGNGQLIYKYAKGEDDPLHSMWVFQFFGKHWASGYSEPLND